MNITVKEDFVFGSSNKFVILNYPIMIFEIEGFQRIKDNLIKEVDKLEKYLSVSDHKKDDGSTGTKNVLTNSHNIFNFFDSPESSVQELKTAWCSAAKIYAEKVYQEDRPMYFKCWANKLKRFEYLKEHVHTKNELNGEEVGFSCHLSLCCGANNHTIYRCYTGGNPLEISIGNTEGQLVIFPSSLPHSTFPNPNEEIRYTIAGDFTFVKPYANYREV